MRLEECLHYLLARAQHSVFQTLRSELLPYGITPVQFGVLYRLWEADGQSPSQIANQLDLDASTLTGVIDRMEQKGLLYRLSDTSDRRVLKIFLTEEGKKLEDPLMEAIEAGNKKVLTRLTDEETRDLKGYLKMIAEFPAV